MKNVSVVPHLWCTGLAPYTLVRYEESLAVVARFRIFMGPLPLRQWYQPMPVEQEGGSSTRGSKCWTPHTRNNGAHLKTFTTPSAAFMSRVNLANSTDSFVGTECIPWPFVVSSSSAPRDKTTAQTAQQCDFETGIRKNSFLEFIIKKYFPRYARLSCWINWSNEIC